MKVGHLILIVVGLLVGYFGLIFFGYQFSANDLMFALLILAVGIMSFVGWIMGKKEPPHDF